MGIQTYSLTHNSNGELKQPYETEFIDFEFNGKAISEFGWVAVSNGDRLSFGHSPTFEDETSSINGVNGQYFWGTHFKTIQRTFNLSSDGLTEQDWNAFKLHFTPGKYGRFIENHLMHRYSYCRVADVSVLSVIPFKETRTVFDQQITINMYKGECSITFIWDEPIYYSTLSYSTTVDKLSARAAFNNGVPFIKSWSGDTPCCIGSDNAILQQANALALKNSQLQTQTFDNALTCNNNLSFYNPSTTPSKSIISLKFEPSLTGNYSDSAFANTVPIYFDEIFDSINKTRNNNKEYNTIYITKANDETNTIIDSMLYTSPDVIYQINMAIQIAYNFYKANQGMGTIIDLTEELRLQIVNSKVMGWAASLLNIIETKKISNTLAYSDGKGSFTTGAHAYEITINNSKGQPIVQQAQTLTWFGYFNLYMLCMLATCANNSNYLLETGNWQLNPYILTFDGENNQTRVQYHYNQIFSGLVSSDVEEICGDAMYSGYLKLDGGDILSEDGSIKTYHVMHFTRGDGKATGKLMNNAKAILKYQYTYL